MDIVLVTYLHLHILSVPAVSLAREITKRTIYAFV